jgi:hypothetical protein
MFGIAVTISGTKKQIRIVNKTVMINGIRGGVAFSIDRFPIAHETKRKEPTGGVIAPTCIIITITTP